MTTLTLQSTTAALLVAALNTAAMSPHHPWCRVATSGPKQPCSCHVEKSVRALEALAADTQEAVPVDTCRSESWSVPLSLPSFPGGISTDQPIAIEPT